MARLIARLAACVGAVALLGLVAACGDPAADGRGAGGGDGPGHATGAAAGRWLCPMHPTYVSDRKSDCPICGMDLVPAAEFAAGGASGIPGMAEVELGADGIALARIRTQKAAIGGMTSAIRAVGTVTADETRVRSVESRVGGWIETLAVGTVGETVAPGQLLMHVYSPELLAGQEELLRALAARRAAADAGASPSALAAADLLVDASRRRLRLFAVPDAFIAQLETGSRPARAVPLYSAVAGVVSERMAYAGMRIEPGQTLFMVTDLSTVWIEVRAYEYEAGTILPGMPATVRLPHDPGVLLQGTVDFVYPTVDPVTRTLPVRLVFANPFGLLRPGMFANVDLAVDHGEAVVIPDDAILDTGTRRIVFVSLGEGRFTPREVTVGARADGRAQILAGVAAGEDVVVRANFLLDSESRIRAALAGPGTEVPPGGHDAGGHR